MVRKNLMELLFGKKSRRKSGVKSNGKKVVKKGKAHLVEGVKPPMVLVKRAKKLKIRTTTGKLGHRKYKPVSVLKKEVKNAMKKAKSSVSKSPHRKRRSVSKRRVKFGNDDSIRQRFRNRSRFGVNGSFAPLSSIMSPYPYSVNASPPWI